MKRNARIFPLIVSALAAACSPGTQTSDSGTTQTDGTASTSPGSDGHSSAGMVTNAMTGTTSQETSTPTDGITGCSVRTDCGEPVIHFEVVKPSVMLVLDKSGSMAAEPGGFWDHDQDPATPMITRWNSLHSVVEQLVVDFDGTMNLGAVLYPSMAATSSYSEAACVVSATPEVPIAPMNAATILAAIPGAQATNMMLRGATPATRGLKLAITELEAAPNDRPRIMIFITDGAANCQENAPDPTTLFEVYDDAVTETVAAAAAMGVKTFVVGIDISQEVSGGAKDGSPDGTNNFEQLNLMAEAGGVPRPGAEKFFNTSNQLELQAALQTIAAQLVDCVLELPFTPKFPDFVEVSPYGKVQVRDCMTEEGWMFLPKQDPDDANESTRIELCGQACSDFRLSGQVDVQFGCPDPDPC